MQNKLKIIVTGSEGFLGKPTVTRLRSKGHLVATRDMEWNIFENGLPKLSEVQSEEEVTKWDQNPLKIILKNKSNVGEDNLKLFFKISKSADLLVRCFDIKDEFLGEYNLGNIY